MYKICYWKVCIHFSGGEGRTRFLLGDMSCFLFTDSILRVEMSRVIVWGKFSSGLSCPEDISMGGGGFFCEGGARFPGAT